jgi:beta-barrel assembly-enhancing protease
MRGATRASIGWIAVGALGLGACSGAVLSNLPLDRIPVESIARLGAAGLPIGPEKEREIGAGIAATVAGRYPLLEDEVLTRYVNLVGHAVAEHSRRRGEVRFVFGVLDTDEVNAFAAPGGYLLVTRGALDAMRSEAELAAVLAHEIAHVDRKHVLEEIRRSAVVQSLRDEGMLSGAVLDRVAEVGTSALFTGLQVSDEMEADSLALVYTAAAGYRGAAYADFLERLAAMEGGGSVEWLRELRFTHPPTSLRLVAVRRQLAVYESGVGVEGAERFRRHLPGRPGG